MSWLRAHSINPDLARNCGVQGTLGGDITFNMGVRYQRIRKADGAMRQIPTGLGMRLWWLVGGDRGSAEVLLLEGESDALAAASVLCDLSGNPRSDLPEPLLGVCPVCLPGTPTPVNVVCGELLAAGCKRCYICLDPDLAGRKATEKITEALPGVGIEPVPISLPGKKDLSDCLVELENATASGDPKAQWLGNLLADSAAACETTVAA